MLIFIRLLTEDRPYKKGLSHEKTCDILDDMSQNGFIDSDISKTIRECFGNLTLNRKYRKFMRNAFAYYDSIEQVHKTNKTESRINLCMK